MMLVPNFFLSHLTPHFWLATREFVGFGFAVRARILDFQFPGFLHAKNIYLFWRSAPRFGVFRETCEI